MISIGILTHNSPITLENTFLSYQHYEFLTYSDDFYCIIQPSPSSNEEIEICNKFNIKYYLETTNGNMAYGIKSVFEHAKYDKVLFSENDFRIHVESQKVKDIMDNSIKWLDENIVDMIRIRNLEKPGHPIHAALFKDKELLSDVNKTQIHYSCHYYSEPDKVFSEYIKKYQDSPRLLIMSSKNCGYTNNCYITTKKFYKENMEKYLIFGGHFEPEIDPHWANADHRIGITDGFMTHVRIDGHHSRSNPCWCCHTRWGGDGKNNCNCCRSNYIEYPIFQIDEYGNDISIFLEGNEWIKNKN